MHTPYTICEIVSAFIYCSLGLVYYRSHCIPGARRALREVSGAGTCQCPYPGRGPRTMRGSND